VCCSVVRCVRRNFASGAVVFCAWQRIRVSRRRRRALRRATFLCANVNMAHPPRGARADRVFSPRCIAPHSHPEAQLDQLTPFSVEDLYLQPKLAELDSAPGGEEVACTVRSVDKENDRYRFAIWTFPLDGQPTLQLTQGTSGNDNTPHWCPEGSCLAFISDRAAARRFIRSRAGAAKRCRWVISAEAYRTSGGLARMEADASPSSGPKMVSNGMNAPTHNGINVPKWKR
jgi:hypothetical protein